MDNSLLKLQVKLVLDFSQNQLIYFLAFKTIENK